MESWVWYFKYDEDYHQKNQVQDENPYSNSKIDFRREQS